MYTSTAEEHVLAKYKHTLERQKEGAGRIMSRTEGGQVLAKYTWATRGKCSMHASTGGRGVHADDTIQFWVSSGRSSGAMVRIDCDENWPGSLEKEASQSRIEE